MNAETETNAPSHSSDAPATSSDSRDAPKVQKHDVSIYRSWCKACGVCVEFCPHDVFEREKKRDPGEIFPAIVKPVDCTGCQQCVLHCPDFAIRVVKIRRTGN